MNVELRIANSEHDGPLLYAVNFIDGESPWTASVELYRAKDIDELHDVVKLHKIGSIDNYAEDDEDGPEQFKMDEANFEDEWNTDWIKVTEIGLIIS